MAMVATDIKGMLSISIKSRHDSHTDQYNRIFMVKILLVSSVVMGISWFQDSISCIVPDSHEVSSGFVSAACWIQGVYVYKELHSARNVVAYFGIPRDMDSDGFLPGSTPENPLICRTNPRNAYEKNPNCRPMHRTFFLQYQWMPFLIASLAICYYLPYIAFRSANSDLISLKNTVKGDDPDAEKIAKYYFRNETGTTPTVIIRIVSNILIKILYLVVNLVALLGLDSLLNGEFLGYGNKWIEWTKLNNSIAYDYMGMRDHPKPGNLLLPPFGYCEMYESAKDIKVTLNNKHKFVCELSQYIIYQYCLIVIWFAIVFGIVLSVIGLLLLFLHYAIGIFGIRTQGTSGKKLYQALSFRQLEYLEFIRKKNVILYGEVLEKLKEDVLGPNAPSLNDEYPRRNNPSDQMQPYPSLPPKDRYEGKPGYQL